MKCVCSRNVCCDLVVGVEAITWEQVDCVPYLWGKDVRVQYLALVAGDSHLFPVLCSVALGW